MFKNFQRCVLSVALGLAVPALVGCDKLNTLKSAKAKLEKLKERKAGAPDSLAEFSSSQISDLKQADYPGFISRKNALVVVDFHAEWCAPCKQMGPVLEKAAKDHPGLVFLGKVDVDHAHELAAAQGVSGIPDVRIYKDGKEVDRMVGFPGEQAVLEKIAKYAKGINPASSGTAAVTPVQPTAKPEVEQFSKGWLPPGMSRGEVKQPPSNQRPPPAQKP